jgi:hypothetical protein
MSSTPNPVAIEQLEPTYEPGETYDWLTLYEILGGLSDNPGVCGHGGVLIMRSVCRHGGRYRIDDT